MATKTKSKKSSPYFAKKAKPTKKVSKKSPAKKKTVAKSTKAQVKKKVVKKDAKKPTTKPTSKKVRFHKPNNQTHHRYHHVNHNTYNEPMPRIYYVRKNQPKEHKQITSYYSEMKYNGTGKPRIYEERVNVKNDQGVVHMRIGNKILKKELSANQIKALFPNNKDTLLKKFYELLRL